MPTWKKIIFINAIKVRMITEKKTNSEIVTTYSKLTAEEKEILLAATS